MQYLYRAFDSSNRLLYVGISGKWSERLHQHERESEWMELTDYVKIERFDTRQEVSEAEKLAIVNEKPIYNKQYNQEWESPQNHFQKLKRWLIDGVADERHIHLIYSMLQDFEDERWGLKKKRSSDVAWSIQASYDYLVAHGYLDCRNCEAIESHQMFQSWAGITDLEISERGYYD